MKQILKILLVGFFVLLTYNSSIASNMIECVELGKIYNAKYDFRDKSPKITKVTAGEEMSGKAANKSYDKGCMGRCGAGCGKKNGQGIYTYDCLVHDVCAFYDRKLGGLFDTDCGDEYFLAIDDFITDRLSICWVSESEYAEYINKTINF